MEANRLRELLEASRPDAVDLGLSETEALELRELLAEDPELAAELERLHAWDGALAGAMDDIAVPAGLASRLQAAVDQELASVAENGNNRTLARPEQAAPRPSRRHWLWGAMVTAAALLIAVGLGTYWNRPTVVDVATLDVEARKLIEDFDALAWQSDRTALPMNAFPDDVRAAPQRWTRLPTALDRQAVAFDLVRPGKPLAVVVAMKTNASSELPSQPSMTPDTSTAGLCVGHWHQGGYVYSLVVSGNRIRYREFLHQPAALTMNWAAPAVTEESH